MGLGGIKPPTSTMLLNKLRFSHTSNFRILLIHNNHLQYFYVYLEKENITHLTTHNQLFITQQVNYSCYKYNQLWIAFTATYCNKFSHFLEFSIRNQANFVPLPLNLY